MHRVLSSLAAAVVLVANVAAAPVPNHPQTQVKTLPKAALAKKAAAAKTQRASTPYQIGLASWYGKQFHGRATASGEDFNMFELTAAHRELPLGTYVKVTNLHNGK